MCISGFSAKAMALACGCLLTVGTLMAHVPGAALSGSGIACVELRLDGPGDPDALLASAFNHCREKKFDSAVVEFKQVLIDRPNDQQALSGLGFTYAWTSKYDDAWRTFNQLASVEPTSLEAEKGLAYTSLYRGDFTDAIKRFRILTAKYPQTKEYWIALGQAYMNIKSTQSAREAFLKARALDPNDREVAALLLSTKRAAAFAELDVWGGYSRVEGDERWGMRLIQLTVQATKNLRVYGKYDNSLSLDNRFFIQTNQFAGAWFAGAAYDWNKTLTSRLEYGYRELPGTGSQQLISFDQAFFIPNRSKGLTSWHVGGMVGIGNQTPNAYLVYGGTYFTLSRRWGFEPTYYFSYTTYENLQQHRFLGALKYMAPKGLELSGGAYWGTSVVAAKFAADQDKVYGAYLLGSYPISRRFAGMLSWRQESGTKATPSVLSLAAGVKIRFEK